MKKIVYFLFLAVCCPQFANAYLPIKTHRLINRSVVMMSALPDYAINILGFRSGVDAPVNGKPMIDWIQDGGTNEDQPGTRGAFHFMDPTKAWSSAGLSGWLGIQFYSNLDWALDNTSAPPPPCEQVITALGTTTCPETSNPNTSWLSAKNYFHQALTSDNSANRDVFFGKAFKSLGHVLHLLADVAVPEHVRNDWHLNGSRYEAWVEDNVWTDDALSGYDLISNFIIQNSGSNHIDYSVITSLSNPEGYPPISNFWDTTPNPANSANSGNITIWPGPGLAEYTNFNFLSKDTIFKYYTYPVNPQQNQAYLQLVKDEDGDHHERVYFSGATTDGKPINHLVSTGYLWDELKTVSPLSMAKFELDENCFYDYAQILVPKAVDYDTALLNYFFRGAIEISLPDDGIYAITGPGGTFNKIKLKAVNTTANDEEMTGGTIQLVVKYKTALTDPFQIQTGCTAKTTDFSYVVASASGDITSLPTGTPTTLTFNLDSGIPLEATDVYLQVVYKGQLGNETDAVAVGFKDIAEPAPHTIANNTDFTCVNGVNLPSEIPSSLVNVNLAFTTLDAPQYASLTNYHAHFASIPPGSYGRVYILTDYDIYTYSRQADNHPVSQLASYVGLSNQGVNTSDCTYPDASNMSLDRGVAIWSGTNFHNNPIPADSVCPPFETPLSGPVSVTIN